LLKEENMLIKTKQIKLETQGNVWHTTADICVVGAGMAGITAALVAARQGKKVILIDSQPQLGGQTFNSNIGCFCGFYSNGKNGYRLTHIIADEMFKDLNDLNGLYERPVVTHTRAPYYNETIFLRWVENKIQSEHNIQVLLGASVRKVNKSGSRRIQSIEAATRFGDVIVTADGFIDASGDAIIAWLAGIPCNVPEKGAVLGSQMFILEGIDYSVPTPSEVELVERLTIKGEEYGLKRKKGLMFYLPERGDIAFGNMTHVETPLDPLKASFITIKGKDQVDAVVKFLKSEFPQNFANSFVRSYGQTGIRQSRWLSGVHQLTVEEVRACKKFDDAIGRTSWPIELHDNDGGYVWEVFSDDHVHYIPFGSLISPELDNYTAAGRCIDADVAALSSVRVMGPCSATGAAAAHALSLAGKGSVHEVDIKKLQDLLKDNLERVD